MKLEERVAQLEFQIKENVKDISSNTERINKLDTIFVRLIEFIPVKNFVYALNGILLSTIIGAILLVTLKFYGKI